MQKFLESYEHGQSGSGGDHRVRSTFGREVFRNLFQRFSHMYQGDE
jgi:hypothetical protein